jgi:Zn-dependent protease with chaperone function
MSVVLQLAQLFLVAGFAFAVIGALSTAALVRVFRQRVLSLAPDARHQVLLGLSLLPFVIALGLLLSASLPSVFSLVVPAFDHCLTHDDHHAHLCFVHMPHVQPSIPFLLLLAIVWVFATWRAIAFAGCAIRATKLLQALARTGEHRASGVTVVETNQAFCVAAGLLKPHVLISRGLLRSLDATALRVVLTHEQMHVQRKHALVASLVRACTLFHLPAVARWLQSEIAVAAEQICDEAAAEALGDRLAVASTILAVERATQASETSHFGPIAFAFGETAVERRVESLLAEPRPAASLRSAYRVVALTTVTLAVGANVVHHVTESFLSLVLQ